ncbi:MAG: hypothetical protein HQL37_14825 [Alphaproteobacteria bacterium]|nr:hypothetical protein [Alphaproteobacteria bacterium]
MITDDDSLPLRSKAYRAVAEYLDREEDLSGNPNIWRAQALETWDSWDAAERIHASLSSRLPSDAVPSVEELESAFRGHVLEHFSAKEDALERFRDAAGIAWAERDGIAAGETTENWRGLIAHAGEIGLWSARTGRDDINESAHFVTQLIQYDGDSPLDDAAIIYEVRGLATKVRAVGDSAMRSVAASIERLATLIAGPEKSPATRPAFNPPPTAAPVGGATSTRQP